MKNFKIANTNVGDNLLPLIIVELGINYDGNLDLAIDLADSAIKARDKLLITKLNGMSIETKKYFQPILINQFLTLSN